jgi:hypothetical protein
MPAILDGHAVFPDRLDVTGDPQHQRQILRGELDGRHGHRTIDAFGWRVRCLAPAAGQRAQRERHDRKHSHPHVMPGAPASTAPGTATPARACHLQPVQ